ncbi:MAG: thioredoxin [Bdellovibrionales bacterium RIFOXYD12_FULL_39_22]|nr:MAG: thioredoxin [Bdellovibrionales bacterium RIFOXYB1_FULL_39_21]OFZ40379.1 MAG: thioredoxin [Bdellovibrionales bacterium RIFOXYC12_FULL_39_17]OFZ49628.1 MAG: thioredoxin [Bdellovibrionales bacterium RIFOXYC1_FULL_39_130]OFZ72365.1 MAG: thioredoxin [Bdellovibrionales bacterium RIFOXYC2_FULL_39_8]OFZ77298.1 MAG: thioredoxin [Bdellovibrionales bacterium RIFOXYD1_FULL_39_84]OFZ95953.1 MAG: thioredoxin [Bdellovibrionales bacterium RIFOXYD12_FULL_39_22]HLE11214.1 thioredoxin [Bacteriovoracacea
MQSNVKSLDATSFNEVLKNSDKPVIVDFWAPWCGPCRMLGPIMEQVATERSSDVVVTKLNVDDFPEIAGRFSIRGIPTVKIFRNGKEINSTSGAYPKEYWDQLLDNIK